MFPAVPTSLPWRRSGGRPLFARTSLADIYAGFFGNAADAGRFATMPWFCSKTIGTRSGLFRKAIPAIPGGRDGSKRNSPRLGWPPVAPNRPGIIHECGNEGAGFGNAGFGSMRCGTKRTTPDISITYTINPVKRGYVENVQDWPYSTFHRCVAEGLYGREWGCQHRGILSFDD